MWMVDVILSYSSNNDFLGGYGMGGFVMFWDPTYILVLIGVVISLVASARVRTTFSRYSRVSARCGMTGAQAAERLLRANNITDVTIRRIGGNLSDHYDPRRKVLSLSDSVYGQTSVAAIAVAAHEVGHCIQHDKQYGPLNARTALVPVANIGSSASWIFIIAGLFLGGSQMLINIGIVLFSAAVLFQVVTLPVEFNASRRALVALENNGIFYKEEVDKGRKVLNAAALTYLAAAAAAILQLLRLLLLFGNRNRD